MILKWSILITLAVAARADPDGLVLQNYVLSDNFIEGKDGFRLPDLYICSFCAGIATSIPVIHKCCILILFTYIQKPTGRQEACGLQKGPSILKPHTTT